MKLVHVLQRLKNRMWLNPLALLCNLQMQKVQFSFWIHAHPHMQYHRMLTYSPCNCTPGPKYCPIGQSNAQRACGPRLRWLARFRCIESSPAAKGTTVTQEPPPWNVPRSFRVRESVRRYDKQLQIQWIERKGVSRPSIGEKATPRAASRRRAIPSTIFTSTIWFDVFDVLTVGENAGQPFLF